MEERGLGYTADILIFVMLVSTAITLLAAFSPVDPRLESERYASSFAQSILLSLQHSSVDQLGGFEYHLDTFGLGQDIPLFGESMQREFRHKTVMQLLAEDALLNTRLEASGADVELSRMSNAMDDELKIFLKLFLDRVVGGRFGYRLMASAEPIDIGSVRVHFEIEVEGLSRARNMLCSVTAMFSLPESSKRLSELVEDALGLNLPSSAKIDTVIEVKLELWSI